MPVFTHVKSVGMTGVRTPIIVKPKKPKKENDKQGVQSNAEKKTQEEPKTSNSPTGQQGKVSTP